jgi:hypothetical protein
MTMLRRLFDVKVLVLCLIAFNGWAFATSALVSAAPLSQSNGDCWKIVGGNPVAVALTPAGAFDCKLNAVPCQPTNGCFTLGNAIVNFSASIKVGSCTTPDEAGVCAFCPDNLTCAVGNAYAKMADCIAGGPILQPTIALVTNSNCH